MASATRVTRSAYRCKGCEVKVDRMEADIERTGSSEDYEEVNLSAAHEAASWCRLAGHSYGEGRHSAKRRSVSPISSMHYTLDPRTGCSLLLVIRPNVIHCTGGMAPNTELAWL